MKKLPAPLAALESYGDRFLICRVTPELTTETVNGLGKIIEPTDEANWLTANSAIAASELMGVNCCVGFVLDGSGLFMFEVPSCDGGAERFEQLVRRQRPWDRYSFGLRESFCSS